MWLCQRGPGRVVMVVPVSGIIRGLFPILWCLVALFILIISFSIGKAQGDCDDDVDGWDLGMGMNQYYWNGMRLM